MVLVAEVELCTYTYGNDDLGQFREFLRSCPHMGSTAASFQTIGVRYHLGKVLLLGVT